MRFKNPQYSYTFGSPIETRTWATSSFRFGFNGKEKDFETASDNYDFGARIYDGRLGRWLSLDPLICTKAFQSAYSTNRNCPILYLDIGGKDEFIYWTIFDERTGKTTIVIEKISNKYDPFPHIDAWNGDLTYVYYHIYHLMNVTIDKNGKRTVTASGSVKGQKKVYSRHPLFQWWGHSSNKDEEGNGERVPGGMKCTAENGGNSPTKTVSDNPGQSTNIDLLIATRFGEGNVANITELSEMVKSIFEKADELAELYKEEHANTVEYCERNTCSNPDCNYNVPENIIKEYEAYCEYGIPRNEKLKTGAKDFSHDQLGKEKVTVRCK